MGVSMERINQGVLDFGKVVTSSMNAWDRVAKSFMPQTTVPATPQTGTPAVTPTAQTTSSKPAGFQITGTMLLIGGLVIAALYWRR